MVVDRAGERQGDNSARRGIQRDQIDTYIDRLIDT